MNVGEEVDRLKEEIKRLGQPQDDGSYKVVSSHILDSLAIFTRNSLRLVFFIRIHVIFELVHAKLESAKHSDHYPNKLFRGLNIEKGYWLVAHYTVDKTYPSLSSDGILSWDLSQFVQVTFGVLFNDDRCANIFEALVGTLRAAKKRKVVAYDGELLLQGVHDNVEITLKPEATASDAVVSS
ncbi:UNVERIFIED_CONTAM: Costars family protein ST45-2 [Sesamum calycinum]|uniref:Costars family protein ST45-2 n=1 Tax=Sesamum calycinum TaxID=2727403 RepID=A0AAW2PQ32_9LAMI